MSLIDQLYNKISSGRSGQNIGLKTGLSKLDWYTGGFQKGIYKLWFAQSGAGKSSIVIYSEIYRILKDYPNHNILHVYFSLEMSSDVLLGKILSLYLYETYGIELSFIDLMSIRNPISEEVYAKVCEAKEWLETVSKNLIIFDKQLNADSFYASMMEIFKARGHFDKVDNGRRTIYTPNDQELIINIIIDHAGLCVPSKGRSKKEEIDLISTYCVRFREVCGACINLILQENRNAGNIDRVKLNATEATLDDAKDSGNPINDATVVVSIYYPIKYQLKTYRGYQVVDDSSSGILGLGSSLRSLILLKNRFGSANKVIPVGFQGSIGRFVELPKPDQIDYSLYQSWKDERIEDTKKEDTNIRDENKVKFSF